MSKKKLLIVCPVVIILLLFVSFFIYVNDYYHASKDALKFLENTNTVNIINIDDGYFFDGEGTDRAIIFYPGAKVEIESYVPFLRELANYGIDCFLIDMPFKIAFLGTNKADNIINNYDYKSYTLMGHSLGGVAATSYVINNSKKIDSIIYLASYPNKKLPDDIYMLSVYGSNDKVLSMDAYNKNKVNWSKNSKEDIIEEGNHANFGYYGKQKGDGDSKYSSLEQENITVIDILDFFKENDLV